MKPCMNQFTYTPIKHLHNVIIVYLSPFSHTHRAFPYTAFPTQTCILFVLTRPNTNLTQYEVWDSLGGQCKGYSLLACATVQFSTLSPEYWSGQHSEDCGNMYLSNVGTQNMIKMQQSTRKCHVRAYVCQALNSRLLNLGNCDQCTHLYKQKQPALLT